MEYERITGRVLWMNTRKGFGMIHTGPKETNHFFMFHDVNVPGGLLPAAKVSFVSKPDPGFKNPRAVDIRPANE